MDTRAPRRTRRVPSASDVDRALVEAEAAIELVASGAAVRVTLTNFRYAERIAPTVLPFAQAAGVALRLERTTTAESTLIIGPRLPQLAR